MPSTTAEPLTRGRLNVPPRLTVEPGKQGTQSNAIPARKPSALNVIEKSSPAIVPRESPTFTRTSREPVVIVTGSAEAAVGSTRTAASPTARRNPLELLIFPPHDPPSGRRSSALQFQYRESERG